MAANFYSLPLVRCWQEKPGAIIAPVIIDFHTHIFPPDIRDNREAYTQRDAAFAEMYSDPKAKMAVAEDLLGSMDKAGVDVSVAMGFGWAEHELYQRHNDYILEAAAGSDGRILPFCMVNPAAGQRAEREVERCASGGARGLGELRPESQGYDLADSEAGELLARLALDHGLILLFHVTEPEGHVYPGKQGLRLDTFCRFVAKHKDIPMVGGHFAGGLPLYHKGPPDDLRSTFLDTAAMPYLYDASVISPSLATLPGRVLLGSDYPLIGQRRQIELVRSSTDEGVVDQILGDNAARLLGL